MVIPFPALDEVSLYFHVPFCSKKCPYCHFYVVPNKVEAHQILIDGFFREIDYWKEGLQSKKLVSIYFGGGTPSLLEANSIEKIIKHIPLELGKNVEITLEANPEFITYDRIKAFSDVGINRISFGIQSLDEEHLKQLGRTHSVRQSIDAIHSAVSAGINNITIDLMYELPDQNLDGWKETLRQAASLPISHLSLYNLTIEPNTLFDMHRESLEKRIPNEETRIKMYEMAIEYLENSGLRQYEISAFARNELYSRHNTGYWLGRSFLGFGPSAFSYWKGKRFRNIPHLNKYSASLLNNECPLDFEEKLDDEKRKKELLVIQLRLKQGVNMNLFESRHGEIDAETKQILNNLVEQELLKKEEATIKLTRRGMLLYDSVSSLLI